MTNGAPSRRASLAICLIGLLNFGTAQAEPRARVLVLPFSGSVPGAPDGPNRVATVIARAAGLTGDEVVVGQTTFADSAALAGCGEETAECFGKLATSMRVDRIVMGNVEPSDDGATIQVKVTIYENGGVREGALSLPTSSIDELVQRLAREAPGLFVLPDETPEPVEPVEPTPAPTPSPTPAPAPEGRPLLHRTGLAPWLVAGGGVALAVVGTGFLLAGKSRQDDVDGAPLDSADDFDHLVDLEDEGARYMKIGNVLLVSGAVVAASGAVWAILRARSGSGADAAPETETVSLTASPLVGGVGFTLSVRTR